MSKRTIRNMIILLLGILGSVIIIMNQNKGSKEQKEHIPLKFGATYMSMNNPYFDALNGSIQEVVEANGDVLISRDPAQDQKKQNQQILELLEDGVVAIFVNPVDWKEITPALKACKEAEVPIFNIDTYVFDSEYVVSSILSDNYNAGVLIAEDIMRKRQNANIVIINDDNINSTNLRVRGFLNTIEGNEAYKVVKHRKNASELEVSLEVMKRIIDSSAEFDVVLGGNDPTALGALAALQQKHVEKEILVYGIDGSPDGKTMIREGYLEGTSAQFPLKIGRKAAIEAYNYLDGKGVEPNIIIPVELITKDNLSEFDVAGWQ